MQNVCVGGRGVMPKGAKSSQVLHRKSFLGKVGAQCTGAGARVGAKRCKIVTIAAFWRLCGRNWCRMWGKMMDNHGSNCPKSSHELHFEGFLTTMGAQCGGEWCTRWCQMIT